MQNFIEIGLGVSVLRMRDFAPLSATFALRRRSNGYLCTSGVNLETDVRFAHPDFLLKRKISAIWRRFPLIFAFYMLNVRHISTSGSFDLLT